MPALTFTMTKIITWFTLMLVGQVLVAQGVKIAVSVSIDSTAESYQLRNFI
jgi:hypothetical protein